ncbi:ABC transporter substrate-binding protein [Nitrospirillum sp. BR 11163]|uniref:ABC transporter substrate-binding protein n=1 Tax=Nitrospirillum sp. BR 11163 TaxID=3104323 RepID=UPI002AFF441E|nr:ABC transporter substrate-binding protein [Nitrospirillum sp. BR 11163]MEA1674654.1 ABC transporter substrate-binding protein [Nitrospirillum sp. BR 11163]
MALRLNRRDLLAGAGALLAAPRPGQAAIPPDLTLSVWRYKLTASYFFEDAGVADVPYRVAYGDLPGGTMVLEALSAGALDYAFMSEIPPIFSVPSNVPLSLIAVVRGDVNNSGLLVQGGSAIHRVEDLKGKRVSYVRATNNHYYLIKILATAGLTFADIVPVPLSVQDGAAAFIAGHIDAIVSGGYATWQLLQHNNARWLISDMEGLYSGNFVIAANRNSLKDPAKAEAIGDYVRREQKVWAWTAQNGPRWAKRWADVTGAPEAFYLQQYQNQHRRFRLTAVSEDVIRDQQDIADTFLAVNAIDRRIDVRPLWDTRYSALLGT